MKTVTVTWLHDDTVRDDHLQGVDVNAKIHADGRGYVEVDSIIHLYRHVDRIRIEETHGH